MMISVNLNREQARKLLMIYRMVRDPKITCIEDYVETLLSDLITQIWDDLRTEIMN